MCPFSFITLAPLSCIGALPCPTAGAEGAGALPIGLKGEAAGAGSDDPPKGLNGELAAGAEGSGALPIGLKGDEAAGAGAALGASFAGS